jgi:hypothetical protein
MLPVRLEPYSRCDPMIITSARPRAAGMLISCRSASLPIDAQSRARASSR